jgi:hypothetical protein
MPLGVGSPSSDFAYDCLEIVAVRIKHERCLLAAHAGAGVAVFRTYGGEALAMKCRNFAPAACA